MKNGKVSESKRGEDMATFSKHYLVFYNGAQTVGWSYVLMQTIKFLIQNKTTTGLWDHCGTAVTIFQSLAVLEIVHCALRLVPSSVVVTSMQVFSRLFQVWMIILPVEKVQNSPTLGITLVAWGIAEVIRYSYYLGNLIGKPPKFLTWCRYSFFYGLYPAGVIGEVGNQLFALDTIRRKQLLSLALPNPLNVSFNFYYANFLMMLSYVPLFPQLFIHMVHQRKKMLGTDPKKSEKQS